ncbi:MAG: hypothetical protein LUQ34_02865 [Euryarchaeota archaeon]|nr:hypothetical protein [Euryarchaeota archaeon]
MTTVCAPRLAVGLAVDAPALGLGVPAVGAAVFAAVVIGLAVVALGLGLGFDDDVQPAAITIAATRPKATSMWYFFIFLLRQRFFSKPSNAPVYLARFIKFARRIIVIRHSYS